ncbi:uncharacterized protein LAJ45_11319 [Morchella importuna]|uniref:uncharacterized protein n=1 Tax=Morchella importuna TaxID=1174673 RepID=UPI001E8CBA75|nr:uncharacterized protein LAJ45_11319 [Morchella importuna]KAH8144658.1 hypothetical protein LAJ45_11319 [Morchella importuna]
MPSPPPEMVNILDHLRFRELNEDLTGLTNINILSFQAADMLKAEATTHTEHLFLNLIGMLGIFNQNSILQKQLESLKDDFKESITKSNTQAMSTTNRLQVECIEGCITATPKTIPPHPPPPTFTPHMTTSLSFSDHHPTPDCPKIIPTSGARKPQTIGNRLSQKQAKEAHQHT